MVVLCCLRYLHGPGYSFLERCKITALLQGSSFLDEYPIGNRLVARVDEQIVSRLEVARRILMAATIDEGNSSLAQECGPCRINHSGIHSRDKGSAISIRGFRAPTLCQSDLSKFRVCRDGDRGRATRELQRPLRPRLGAFEVSFETAEGRRQVNTTSLVIRTAAPAMDARSFVQLEPSFRDPAPFDEGVGVGGQGVSKPVEITPATSDVY